MPGRQSGSAGRCSRLLNCANPGFESKYFEMGSPPVLLPEGDWKEVPGAVVAPKGFTGTGMYTGMRATAKGDVALVVCEAGAVAAGAFTQNMVCAAPVTICKESLKKSGSDIRAVCSSFCTHYSVRARADQWAVSVARLQLPHQFRLHSAFALGAAEHVMCPQVLINAGQANAATGTKGMEDARAAQQGLAKQLGCKPEQVLVMSTGVIGRRIALQKLLDAVPELVDSLGRDEYDGTRAAVSITTTGADD
jgi:glutamate N-acetyltransferase / amino-acid N-acetyltransferase